LVKSCLVTTADERTWPINKPVVFLGEWCKRFSRKNVWQNIKSETVPYHWDNREEFYKDYQFLKDLHEDLIVALSTKLNSIHQVNHSVRYWRILIGPWLGIFVQMLFDRWKMLELAFEKFDIDSCYVNRKDERNIIPNDMDSFIILFKSDAWNEAIYAQLLSLYFNDIKIYQLKEDKHSFNSTSIKLSWNLKIKNAIYSLLHVINKMLPRSDDIFILNSTFSKKKDIQIQWKFRQLPKIWRTFKTSEVELKMESRKWRLHINDNLSKFSKIVTELIPYHIPKVYLEGYKTLINNQIELPWPKNPRVILTGTSFFSDDVFKGWAASKVELDSSLIIVQHGGNFGMTPRAFLEEHQIEICDFFASWGWLDNKNSKVFSIGNLKDENLDPVDRSSGNALMVEYALSRYSYQLYSVPIASQWLDYFEEQCRFIDALPQSLQEQVKVRLGKEDLGWDQELRWKNQFPNIDIDYGNRTISDEISKSRLYISTYNATTFLVSLAWNMPTIIFWNPKHWEINDSALVYFNLLESVGIFHKTPESAAKQMINIWDDIPSWWENDKVQSARKQFCQKFSKVSDDSLNELRNIIQKASKNKKYNKS